jgi:hypothetical protein
VARCPLADRFQNADWANSTFEGLRLKNATAPVATARKE